MSKQYIEREVLLLKLQKVANRGGIGAAIASIIIPLVQTIPAADVAPVRHGKWIKTVLTGCEPYYQCSLCGKGHNQDYDYCNRCGAHMDGGNKHEKI